MAYRNGTYVAFHANGTDVPIDSDIKYYNLMKAWTAKTDDDFTMINSHDKASAVRDTSKKSTLRASLLERLRNSRNFVLIVGGTTRFDTDWVPFEIESAVDTYGLPIIVVYPGYLNITNPEACRSLWPVALAQRIDNATARTIHISFRKEPLAEAIGTFDHNNLPGWPLTWFTRDQYAEWGLISDR